MAGTDPTNAASYFVLMNPAQKGLSMSGRVLSWGAVSGRYYSVDASTNMALTIWQALTNDLPAPVNSWTDNVLNAGNARYRLRVRTD